MFNNCFKDVSAQQTLKYLKAIIDKRIIEISFALKTKYLEDINVSNIIRYIKYTERAFFIRIVVNELFQIMSWKNIWNINKCGQLLDKSFKQNLGL